MRKKNNLIMTLGLFSTLGITLLSGCSRTSTDSSEASSQSSSEVKKVSNIDLRSNANQTLKIGEEMTIVYLLKDSTKEVAFSSTNENVVTVDEFANVRGVGEGEADVKIYVVSDPTDFVTVHFTINKPFFLHTQGYYNGTVDFTEEDDGKVIAKADQVQILANESGKTWYFKAHIKRTGYANNDNSGRWGLGSFYVDNKHPIGNNMFWYGFKRPTGAGENVVTPYYGGWRYAEGITQNETDIDPSYSLDVENGVDVEIIRKGKMHYFCWTTGDSTRETVKYAYSVPFFENVDTYPGIYSQNQILEITNFESTSVETEVEAKLDSFQKADSLSINCVDNRLINGNTYQLSSTVLPATTPNKTVTYSLYEAKEGVTLTEDGLLTIAAGTTGIFRVTATAKNNPNANEIRKFEAINAPETGGTYINEGMLKLDATDTANAVANNVITVNSGNNYIPLNASSDSWVATLGVKNTGDAIKDGQIGVMSATNGYMNYRSVAFDYDANTQDRQITSLELASDEEEKSLTYARSGSDVLNVTNEMVIIKDKAKLYVAVDGRLLGVYDSIEGATTPVVFSKGEKAEITVKSLLTGESNVSTALNSYDFFTGGNVIKTGNNYSLKSMNFTGNDMNWPPENGFANGIKSKTSISGDYDISFTLSDIDPLGTGSIDSKILVYLNTVGTTCSLQLVIKGTKDNPTYALCPNYDDATWTEYSLSSYNIDWANPVTVKIEKREEGCKVYFNDVSVLDGSDALANDNYDWSATSAQTPGIGTFKCGATISNPAITAVKK